MFRKVSLMHEEMQSIYLRQLNQEYLDLYFDPVVKSAMRKKKLRWFDYIKITVDFIWYRRYMELYKKLVSKIKKDLQVNEIKFGVPYAASEETKDYKVFRTVVYTCIFGDYIQLQNPMYMNPNYDYYVITDSPIADNCQWKTFDYQSKEFYSTIRDLSPREKNRWFKLHPHLLFPEYDYSVYLDGRIRLISDIMPMVNGMEGKILGVHLHATKMDCLYEGAKTVLASRKAPKDMVAKQLDFYKREGYPAHNGLFENGILIRNHNDSLCMKVMEEWWNQLCEFTVRDQLSLNYVLWKNHVDKNRILILGNNIYRNPNFRFFEMRGIS